MPLNLKNPNALTGKELDPTMKRLVEDWAPTLNRWSLNVENQLNATHKLASKTPNIAAAVATQVVAGSGAGVTSVALTAPGEFVVSGSPGTGVVNLGLAWATEPAGYELQVPVGTVGFDGAVGTSGLNAGPLALTSGATSTSTEWALFVGLVLTANFTSLVQSGWTALPFNDANDALFYRSIPTNGSVSVNDLLTTTGSFSGAIMNFSGSAPTVLQSTKTSDIGTGTMTVSFPGNTSAGSYIIAIYNCSSATNVPTAGIFTDTQTLNITPLSFTSNAGDGGHTGTASQVVLLSTAIVAAEAVTVTYPLVNGGSLFIYEISGLSPIAVKPRFMPEGPTSLSNVTGRVSPFNGGTGSNLSITGGTSQFLKQGSVGAAITVVRPDYPDLSGVGKAAKYNNIVTAGNGLTMIDAVFDQAGNTANIALTNLTSSIGGSGQVVRVSFFVGIHRAATTSSTLPDLQIKWTDQDSGVVQTATFQNTPGTGNNTTTNFSGTLVMSVAASTAITYQVGVVQGYVSTGATTMAYGVHLRAEII